MDSIVAVNITIVAIILVGLAALRLLKEHKRKRRGKKVRIREQLKIYSQLLSYAEKIQRKIDKFLEQYRKKQREDFDLKKGDHPVKDTSAVDLIRIIENNRHLIEKDTEEKYKEIIKKSYFDKDLIWVNETTLDFLGAIINDYYNLEEQE